MRRAIREQTRCKELNRARKHCAHLNRQLDEAEAIIQEQDEQIEELVEGLRRLAAQVIDDPSMLPVRSHSALSVTLDLLARYKNPIVHQLPVGK